MEPVTHILTGTVLARTGFNRRAAYATLAMAIAAEFPDIDTLWSLGGPIVGFEHHRGITHTLLGLPFEAALITGGFWLFHRLRQAKPTKAPPRWAELYGFTLLALLTHLWLDWTNNYGIRPFFPFDPHWFAGSFVFIFDPVLFLLLVCGLVLPALFGLINAEVGARKPAFVGRGWAVAALVLVCGWWTLRFSQHAIALREAAQNPPVSALGSVVTPDRVFASPDPADPFRWHAILDTPGFYQLESLNSRTGIFDPPSPADTLFKPATTLPLLAARRSFLGRVYLDWSMYPVLSQSADTSDPRHPLEVVTFDDARFLYDTFLDRGRTTPPISGTVTLDMQAPEGQRVVEQTLNGRVQR